MGISLEDSYETVCGYSVDIQSLTGGNIGFPVVARVYSTGWDKAMRITYSVDGKAHCQGLNNGGLDFS